MTLKLIGQRSRELHGRTRRKLLGTLAGPLVVGFLYLFSLKTFPTMRNVLHPLLASALAWSFAGLYLLNRGMWSGGMPQEVGISTGLEYCRREVERQLYLLQRFVIWSLGPILLAMGAPVLALATVGSKGRGILPNGLPFLILATAWIAAYFVVRFREQRCLRREIDELKEMEHDRDGA
ncbi:MAG: hypothetical protein ACJ74Y_15450 [Bryobacteraceae bacterium]